MVHACNTSSVESGQSHLAHACNSSIVESETLRILKFIDQIYSSLCNWDLGTSKWFYLQSTKYGSWEQHRRSNSNPLWRCAHTHSHTDKHTPHRHSQTHLSILQLKLSHFTIIKQVKKLKQKNFQIRNTCINFSIIQLSPSNLSVFKVASSIGAVMGSRNFDALFLFPISGSPDFSECGRGYALVVLRPEQ